jgi:hypothetical protein
MAVKSRLKSSKARAVRALRLAYSAPVLDQSTIEELRRFMLPATKALPFVRLRADDQPMCRPESFWHVRPTGKRETDIRLGRRYACEAIAAMKADHNSHLIAHIVQDIIKDAAERAGKQGRIRSPIALGFLIGLSEAVAAVAQPEPRARPVARRPKRA